jgi:hypothetical protein
MKTFIARKLTLAGLMALSIGPVAADDGAADSEGKPVLRSMSKDGGTVPSPVPMAEHAFVAQMKFYVPAQQASGATTIIDYFNADGALVSSAGYAKPLISAFHFGPVVEVEGVGFIGHGKRDAFAAVSLDDGLTWKKTNLSESASETSCDGSGGSGGCNVVRADVPLFADTAGAYPGDVINVVHSIAGNRVLLAWPSRFCESGQPNYALDTAEPSPEQIARRSAIATYLGIDLGTASKDDLYLVDMFGNGGQQGSVDYAEDKFEINQVVGQVPYSCLWTARGVLVQGDDPRTEAAEASYMRWFNAERLTSGRRDVNRVETVCVAGAGCGITWQEDPEGLRPGQGEGPGEGWSGAIANSQTDVWYSYIPWTVFDVVQNPTDATGATPMAFLDYEAAATGDITQKPKPFVPFAMPMRLTDNAKCNTTNPTPYCNGSAIMANFPDIKVPMDYGLKDMCASIVQIPTGQQGTPTDICVSAAGLPNVGNTASTRPRLGMYGYASSGNVADPADTAFVLVVAEEDKGLGKFTFLDGTTVPCEPTEDENCNAFDEGKNIKYHSFSMKLTDTVGGKVQDSLVANLTSNGGMLNQPEVDWRTGNFYPLVNTATLWDFGTFNFDIYNTEIARRGSLLAQDIYKVTGNTTKAKERLIALPTWKQGSMNQGGPADVMSRRILVPKNWKLTKDGNPYAFRNMACSNWVYKTGNAYYPEGICMDSAINLSATIPDTCTDTETDQAANCPQVNFASATPFGIGDTDPILQGVIQGEGNTTKVLSWHQCQKTTDTYTTATGQVVSCANDQRADTGANKTGNALLDQSWYNPLDVAKGHRGFLDGDFVMMLYAWSPNWRLNAKGSDRYELYIRRSFDGGMTWTTLPKNYAHWDGSKHTGAGTVTCETFRSAETGTGDLVEPGVCNTYLAGGNEQARNVTQHKSMRITTLDPRFAITGSPQGVSNTTDPFGTGYTSPTGDDVRDPSRYFIVYETGDNTTTEFGEPEAEDLFYSRAVLFGDHYQVWAELTDLSQCYPSNPHDNEVPAHVIGTGFCNEFDQLEQGIQGLEASEASLTASPGGQFLYGAWAEVLYDEITGELAESDAMARRVWWLEGYIPTTAWDFGQGSGDGTPANP